MEPLIGIEPISSTYEAVILPIELQGRRCVEPPNRVELLFPTYHAGVLPLNYEGNIWAGPIQDSLSIPSCRLIPVGLWLPIRLAKGTTSTFAPKVETVGEICTCSREQAHYPSIPTKGIQTDAYTIPLKGYMCRDDPHQRVWEFWSPRPESNRDRLGTNQEFYH